MAITGTHALFYTPEPEALLAVLRDVFEFPHVDAGEGWLIFALPPAETGVHPGEKPAHMISFMCDDIDATVAELRARAIKFKQEPEERGYGVGCEIVLPGGVEVQLYQPHHQTAI